MKKLSKNTFDISLYIANLKYTNPTNPDINIQILVTPCSSSILVLPKALAQTPVVLLMQQGVLQGYAAILRVLLEAAAAMDPSASLGAIPLQWVVRKDFSDVAELLSGVGIAKHRHDGVGPMQRSFRNAVGLY